MTADKIRPNLNRNDAKQMGEMEAMTLRVADAIDRSLNGLQRDVALPAWRTRCPWCGLEYVRTYLHQKFREAANRGQEQVKCDGCSNSFTREELIGEDDDVILDT